MVRRMVAVLAGVAVAVLFVILIQRLGHSLYPPPADLDVNDQEFMRQYVASLPWGPLTFVIASYAVATLAGGWLAGAISGERPLLFASIIATIILAGALATAINIPHPSWFTIATIVAIVLAALLASALASRNGGGGKGF